MGIFKPLAHNILFPHFYTDGNSLSNERRRCSMRYTLIYIIIICMIVHMLFLIYKLWHPEDFGTTARKVTICAA